ncbi:MAG: DEAD/DEAH box helicase [Planctomycetes bacterium]|nr:DEAD/DEAH box helicase [Planctomycetota bacterium]
MVSLPAAVAVSPPERIVLRDRRTELRNPLAEAATAAPPPEESEAYRELLSRAHRQTGLLPEPLVVKHVLSVTRGADWPVRRAALEALLRRLQSGKKDRLRIASRPISGSALGPYTTRRARSSDRPYETVLAGLDPIRGSCNCPDFLRNSLAVCKHLLAILEDIFASPGKLKRALADQDSPSGPTGPSLIWNPVRPLTGPGDRLLQIRWNAQKGGDPSGNGFHETLKKWFRRGPDGALVLDEKAAADPGRRLEMVNDLLERLKSPRRSRGSGAFAADPALRAILLEERARLQAADRLRDLLASKALFQPLKQKLFPYQKEGVKRFLECGRLLLADDMGLGKTAQAVACCQALWNASKIQRGLIVTPASLKPQWLREWQNFSDAPVAVVDGPAEQREEAYRLHPKGFLIANYEQVIRDLEVIHRWNPELMVLDEAQRIKNWATKTAAYVKKLKPPYRLVLTGTPMENRLEELASILDWVDDHALEPKWRLVPWHTLWVDGNEIAGGARHLDTLRERLKGCMVRRVRQEVLDQLPERTDTPIPVPMTSEQKEEHDSLRQPIAALMRTMERRPLTQAEFLKLMSLLTTQRIICNGLAQLRFEEVWPSISRSPGPGETLLHGLASPKLSEFREIISQLVVEQERKVVVFSQWRRMLRLSQWAIQDLLAGCGACSVFFTGEEGQRRRTQNIVDFHDDPDTRVLFLSDAGGVGLNLQRAASCMINLELPWNPAVLEQRVGRIHRLGQKQPINVYYLISQEGIEERIAGIVTGKKALFTGLFDGTSDEIRFEKAGSFLSCFEKIVEPARAPDLPPAAGADGEEEAMAEQMAEQDLLPAGGPADESKDSVPELPQPGAGPARALPAPETAAPKAAPPETAAAEAPPSPAHVKGLFERISMRRSSDGSLTIKAPPEAASTLASLFEGFAQLLRGAGN